jgi:hypothetical protein
MINLIMPIDNMDWNKLIAQRNALVDLQKDILENGKYVQIEALDTAISIIERLMSYYEYTSERKDSFADT